MVTAIYKKNTVLYAQDGIYTLKEMKEDRIIYDFQAWCSDEKKEFKNTVSELSNIIGRRLVWAVWDETSL